MSKNPITSPLSEEDLQKLANGIAKGATIAQALNIKPETLEGLYALAHRLYSAHNYKDAATIFHALTLYNYYDYRFWMGLAGSYQGLEDFEKAFGAYQVAAVATSMKNPEPLLYACRCLVRMNRKEDAVAGLQVALTLGDKKDPRTIECHQKVRALLDLIQKKD